MAYVVRMPKLGVEMETGVVTDWHVAVSDPVAEDEVIAGIESEKTAAEVAAREAGLLRVVYMAEGDEGPPGAPMGIVAGPHEDVSDLAADVDADPIAGGDSVGDDGADETGGTGGAGGTSEAAGGAGGTGEAAGGAGSEPPDDTSAPDDGTAPAEGGTTPSGGNRGPAGADVAPRTPEGRIKATPRARKRAEELGVALSTVSGSGPEGAIVAADVEAAGESASGHEAGERTRTVAEERSLTPMRRTIADRLERSAREAPHVTVDREVEVEAALSAADRADAASEADVAVTDVVLAAVSATLAEHPAFNATYDAEAERHTLYREHDVGIAVDVDGGLVTPVLPDLRGRTPVRIATDRRRLVDRVLAGEYDAADLSGGTFTVSNLGAVGSDSFTPIIDPPEVAILGVNRIRERPVNTGAGIEFRRHVTFSLSFDHRVVDGADAARFLATLDDHLADAGSLLGDG